MIHVTFRDGPMHTQDQFDSLCVELQDIWTSIAHPSHSISTAPEELTLNAVYVTGAMLTAMEFGFIVARPGKEKEWTMGNIGAFKQRAQEGNKDIAGLLQELQSRMKPAE